MNDDRISLNVRLLAILVGGALLILILLFAVHRFQVKRQATIYLDQARAAKKAVDTLDDYDAKFQQLRKASSNYARYAQTQPRDLDVVAEQGLMLADAAETFARAGRIHDASQLYGQGLACLEKVLREEPQRLELRRKLVLSLFALGQFDQAVNHIALLATVPSDTEGLRNLFDRYDLWQRAAVARNVEPASPRDEILARFLVPESKSVDRDAVLSVLNDDLWMALEDAELLSLFGKCHIGLNRLQSAEKPLEKAILLAPGNLETYRVLADLLNRLDRRRDADYWMSEAVNANRDSFDAIRRRGEYRAALVRRARKADAPALARDALADALDSVSMALEQAVDKADSAAPSSPLTAEFKAAFDAARAAKPPAGQPVTPAYRDRLLETARILKRIVPKIPDVQKELDGVRDALALAAGCELAAAGLDGRNPDNPHLQDARAYATALVELFPGHSPAYLTLAEAEQQLGRSEQAIEWLRRGSHAKDTRPMVLWQLAYSLIVSGRLDEARQVIKDMADEGSPEAFLVHLQAMIDYSEGRWLLAKDGFEKALPQLEPFPDSALRANLLIANCCERLGLVDQQRAALMRAASLDATSVDVLLNLAELEMRSGQFDEAVEDYSLVLRLRSAPPAARLGLARALLAKNLGLPKAERNWGEVEAAINEAEKALPGTPALLILRAESLAARDKAEEAATLLAGLRQGLQQDAARLRTQLQAARDAAKDLSGDAAKKKQDEAAQLDRRIRECDNLQASVWQSLVGLAERQKNWDAATQLIQTAESESGDSPQIRLLKARNLAARDGAKAAPHIKTLLQGSDAFSATQQAWLFRNLAMIAYDIRDHKTADDLCARALAVEPNQLETHKLRLQIAAARKDIASMEDALDRIKKIEGEPDAFWHYGEALRCFLMVEQGGSTQLLQRALQELAVAAQLSPKWGQINVLTGMVYEKMGNGNEAIDQYLEAVELGAADPAMVRRTAQLLIRNNRLRDANRMFRLLAEREPLLSSEMGKEVRWVKARLGEFDAALEPARNVAATSNDAADHIWLGQLLAIASQRMRGQQRDAEADSLLKEAEAAFRQAVILKIDAPEPWVALIQFLAETGQVGKAEKTIAQARLKLPPAVAAAALGRCYEVLNQPDKAAQQYELAVSNAPRDAAVAENAATFYHRTNQIAQARAQLLRIIQGDVDASKEQIAHARQRLALLLSQQGGAKNRDEAIVWIDRNLAENPKSTTDQYLKAIILASDLTGKRNQEAIAALEKIVATQGAARPEIQFTLAQVYRADGNWREYRLRMDKLLKTHRDVPQYVADYVNALIEQKDYHQAEIMATQLAKLAPADVQTVILRSELAFQQRQFERARRLWRDFLEDPAIKSPTKEQRLALVADALGTFARRLRDENQASWADILSKEAQQLYRQYVEAKPGRDLLMASFLARQQRLNEAIDLIDNLWETSTPDQIARACFDVVDGTGATPEQMIRVDQILQKAAQQHPDAMVLQIAGGVLRGLQDRFEDAEAVYRRILDKNPDNPTALNNLAVLLALQGVKLDEAASLMNRAITVVGPGGLSGDLLDSRAIVQLARNQPESALEDIQKALAEKPTPMRYFHQAEAFHASGQRKAAVQAFQRALDMGLREDQLQGVERRKFAKLQVLLK